MMCLLSTSGGAAASGSGFASSSSAAADSTTSGAAATSASVGVASSVDNPSPLDSFADSPIDFDEEEEEEEDSGRGSSGDSDKENQCNQYNGGSSAPSTSSSILKRLLANPDEPARPEWARKNPAIVTEAALAAEAPLPSPRHPSNTSVTVNADAAAAVIVRKRVRKIYRFLNLELQVLQPLPNGASRNL